MDVLLQKKLDLRRLHRDDRRPAGHRQRHLDRQHPAHPVRGRACGSAIIVPATYSLPPDQEAALLRVGEYARHHGIGVPEGNNCGIDYFVGPGRRDHRHRDQRALDRRPVPDPGDRADQARGHGLGRLFRPRADRRRPTPIWTSSRRIRPARAKGAFSCVSLGFSPFEQDIGGLAAHLRLASGDGRFPRVSRREIRRSWRRACCRRRT